MGRKPAEHETKNKEKRRSLEIKLIVQVREYFYDQRMGLERTIIRFRKFAPPEWIADIVYYRREAWVLPEDSETQWEAR